MAVFIADT